ncbi:hypothetical protein GE21DRAFT_6272 [Neurospora crassa]|uniref:Uncharacterized protein n=2 Tax=Neurospora crassa TaxID=5141 RepID=Q7SAJ8_NEUCR|nr:hypothetical protein NCU08043 [Neurospora crassa OR74A]EAA33477.1 hypothetical protein NCU08043 [Neurospora crassa OR74A]KHE84390.1 hypothetical protein GE21DRAFT_6272 [Neurospora crassa]CAE85542.1 hypothetical protein B2E7.110 [Neurospora crassa]|eukprot:XP_962713.1 hypothetical protein NCU08043 [Neurospora crassa OR74A]
MAEAIDGLTQGQTLAPWYMLVVTGVAQAEKAVARHVCRGTLQNLDAPIRTKMKESWMGQEKQHWQDGDGTKSSPAISIVASLAGLSFHLSFGQFAESHGREDGNHGGAPDFSPFSPRVSTSAHFPSFIGQWLVH